MKDIGICWIIPPYTQVKVVPGEGSPLKRLVSPGGEVVTYDSQMNYPQTSVITNLRQLQSALPEIELSGSVLNLSAVPRERYIEGTWEEEYLGEIFKKVPFGKSTLEFRRIGKKIEDIEDLEEVVRDSDIIVLPSPFETHIPEIRRIASYLKSRYGSDITLLASGTGVEGHENELLLGGIDCVYTGTIPDGGEKVLIGLLERDYIGLSMLPGINIDINGMQVRNAGPRNFRRDEKERRNDIVQWRKNLPTYNGAIPIVTPRMVGRPDLETSLKGVDPLIEYSAAMQDLPFDTVSNIIEAGEDVVFVADDFFPTIGCPRECDFCHAAGSGSTERNLEFSLELLEFYNGLGATDIIPTDDQILLTASAREKSAQDLVEIYRRANELGFKFFYGNGIETGALDDIIGKSLYGEQTNLYKRLFGLFCDTAGYIYLPYEDISGLEEDGQPELRKLSQGRNGFLRVLNSLNNYSLRRGRIVEIGTNIIFPSVPTEEEIHKYYDIMDAISRDGTYAGLNIRYNGFFMIPSGCAPHILNLESDFDLSFANKYPELKIVSMPVIMNQEETTLELEERLAWNLEARNHSQSRRALQGGTYEST